MVLRIDVWRWEIACIGSLPVEYGASVDAVIAQVPHWANLL